MKLQRPPLGYLREASRVVNVRRNASYPHLNSSSVAKWLKGWRRRRRILVRDFSDRGLRGFQVAIDLDGVLPSLPPLHAVEESIIVTAGDGVTPVPYWVDAWDGDARSVWVRVNIPAGGEEQFFIYYDQAGWGEVPHHFERGVQEQVLVEGVERIPHSPSDFELHLSEVSDNYLRTIIECRKLH